MSRFKPMSLNSAHPKTRAKKESVIQAYAEKQSLSTKYTIIGMQETKKGLDDKLSTSTELLDTLSVLREQMNIQISIQRIKRRLMLSNQLISDKKSILSMYKTDRHQMISKLKSDNKQLLKECSARVDYFNKLESIFLNEELSRELASYLFGQKIVLHAITNGHNIGTVEYKKINTSATKKAALSFCHNVIILSKVGSDVLIGVIYVDKKFQFPSIEECRSNKLAVKISGYSIQFPSIDILNKAKEAITGRCAWFEDMKAERKLYVRQTISLMKVSTLQRRNSISYWNSPQISPSSVEQKVLGVSLNDLVRREKSQQAPLVYRLLIQYIGDNCCDVEGILRLSGSQNDIEKMKLIISKRTFSLQDLNDIDPHAISSTLKLLFKQLPIPLIPSNIDNEINKLVTKNESNYVLISKLYEYLLGLKNSRPEHFEVFRLLCKMFTEIINRSSTNKMTLSNVLTCFVESVRCRPAVFSCVLQNQGLFFDMWK